MRTVGLKTLKNKLSEYVRVASRGETVLVTNRDRVVAELGPPKPGRTGLSADLMAEGAREGWLTPPARPNGSPPAREPVAPIKDLLREMEQDRDRS